MSHEKWLSCRLANLFAQIIRQDSFSANSFWPSEFGEALNLARFKHQNNTHGLATSRDCVVQKYVCVCVCLCSDDMPLCRRTHSQYECADAQVNAHGMRVRSHLV